jgi:putative tricarboxylic transport membrane protein
MPESLIADFLLSWTDPYLLLIAVTSTFAGIYIGALPGLSTTMGVSILISLTFTWSINSALVAIAGVYVGGVYGGARTAILLNIPGTPAAVATALDGFPLGKRGEAGVAISLGTVMHFIGGLMGFLALAVAAPMISDFALMVAPRDFMLLTIMGILLVASLSGESLAKGAFAGGLGVIVSLVGIDPITTEGRFTFGSVELMGGISFVPLVIGLFGLSEVFHQVLQKDAAVVKQQIGKILPPLHLVLRCLPISLRSSVIGVIIGVLPGAGGDIAALLAYDHARRTVKNPSRPFGTGAYEGVAAPETANSASIGGDCIPMLTLGIPGDAVTAVIIGAFIIHGLQPGPMLMVERPDLFWFIVGTFALSNVLVLVLGLMGVRYFIKIVETPRGVLMPIIVVLSVVGSYALQNSVTDVYWMVGAGVLGYFMKVYGYQVSPLVLGAVLGPLMDVSYRRAMISSRDRIPAFLWDLVSHPISLVLTLIVAFLLISSTPLWPALKNRVLRRRLDLHA